MHLKLIIGTIVIYNAITVILFHKLFLGHGHSTLHSSSYSLNAKHLPTRHANLGNKISVMQPHTNLIANAQSSLPPANPILQPTVKMEASRRLKREHDKTSELGILVKDESMSPRKKPRKQTHIVAEGKSII